MSFIEYITISIKYLKKNSIIMQIPILMNNVMVFSILKIKPTNAVYNNSKLELPRFIIFYFVENNNFHTKKK